MYDPNISYVVCLDACVIERGLSLPLLSGLSGHPGITTAPSTTSGSTTTDASGSGGDLKASSTSSPADSTTAKATTARMY
jgi:hypothetical protein